MLLLVIFSLQNSPTSFSYVLTFYYSSPLPHPRPHAYTTNPQRSRKRFIQDRIAEHGPKGFGLRGFNKGDFAPDGENQSLATANTSRTKKPGSREAKPGSARSARSARRDTRRPGSSSGAGAGAGGDSSSSSDSIVVADPAPSRVKWQGPSPSEVAVASLRDESSRSRGMRALFTEELGDLVEKQVQRAMRDFSRGHVNTRSVH
jgi:hypothetical protein